MILYNAFKTPDGTLLESKHPHDFIKYTDSFNHKEYFIDGGKKDYRDNCDDECEPLFISFNKDAHLISEDRNHVRLVGFDDFDVIRHYFSWGSYGKKSNEPLHFIALKDMETSHIKAILHTQSHIDAVVERFFEMELDFRNDV